MNVFFRTLVNLSYTKHKPFTKALICFIVLVCFVAIVENHALVLTLHADQISLSLSTLFWIWSTFLPDFFILIMLSVLLVFSSQTWIRVSNCCILLGICFALCILIVLNCNIVMLMQTGKHSHINI
jgi:hypothetical protein